MNWLRRCTTPDAGLDGTTSLNNWFAYIFQIGRLHMIVCMHGCRQNALSIHSIMEIEFPLTTTMPISFFSVLLTCSTPWSKTMFMNWSYPRSTPVTVLLALSFTVWNSARWSDMQAMRWQHNSLSRPARAHSHSKDPKWNAVATQSTKRLASICRESRIPSKIC